jgi:hypothetical protein
LNRYDPPINISRITCTTCYSILTLRDYKPGAWVLYARVINQSTDDIFIKPRIVVFIRFIKSLGLGNWCYSAYKFRIIVITTQVLVAQNISVIFFHTTRYLSINNIYIIFTPVFFISTANSKQIMLNENRNLWTKQWTIVLCFYCYDQYKIIYMLD